MKYPLRLPILEIRHLRIVDESYIFDEAAFCDFAFAGGEPGCAVGQGNVVNMKGVRLGAGMNRRRGGSGGEEEGRTWWGSQPVRKVA